MTHTPADVGLAPDAAARFDDYLGQVRSALVRTPDVNPDEIEADIREHVGHELLDAPRPVPLAALEAVLRRLGPPSQWGTGEDPTLLHRVRHVVRGARATLAEQLRGLRAVLWRGPEDWRLTYLSFGAFAIGLFTFGVLMPICLPLSYLLARAGLTHAREKGLALGGRKWLLYPPVVLVSLILLVTAVVWPVGLGGVAAEEVDRAQHRVARAEGRNHLANGQPVIVRSLASNLGRTLPGVERDRKILAVLPADPDLAPAAAGLFVGTGAVLLWWLVLGSLAARYPQAIRAAFCPLCDGFESGHGRLLSLVCFGLLIPWAATAYEVVVALR